MGVRLEWFLRGGLQEMPESVSGTLLILADQRLITKDIVLQLMKQRWQTLAAIVAPTYQGQGWNPTLFDRRYITELAR